MEYNSPKEIAIAFAQFMDDRKKSAPKFRLAKPTEELFDEFWKQREKKDIFNLTFAKH